MKIHFSKINAAQHQLKITREDGSADSAVLHTQTYFLHDLIHFVVESELLLQQGFWGLIAKGHQIADLSGKENPLTEELRKIECIVGGLQSVYRKHQTIDEYFYYLQINGIKVDDIDFVSRSVVKIEVLSSKFKHLEIGNSLDLRFFL